MDEEKVLAGGMNITGFQLINRTKVQNHSFFKELSTPHGTSRVPINVSKNVWLLYIAIFSFCEKI